MFIPIFQPFKTRFLISFPPADYEAKVELYDLSGGLVNTLKVESQSPVTMELSSVFPVRVSKEYRIVLGYIKLLSGFINCYLHSDSKYFRLLQMKFISGNSIVSLPPSIKCLFLLNLNNSWSNVRVHKGSFYTSFKCSQGVTCLPIKTEEGFKLSFLDPFYIAFLPGFF